MRMLTPAPSPADNPLKGLVPYAGKRPHAFPHSLEFQYLPLSALMTGPDSFDWQPLETVLQDISSRGNQAIFRIWLEYPGRKSGVPAHLLHAGLRITEWTHEEFSAHESIHTPDYHDPRLRQALRSFIAALGKRYDADPRIGFITAGLLGHWGEWHTYPRAALMADETVQAEIMDAYDNAFATTPVLLRYPAGEHSPGKAANHLRRFGYHDDSFAWATLPTGRGADHWFYLPALEAAGLPALQKWRSQPIGGEIRPELWGRIFDADPAHPKAQDFAACVRATHVTWLMDSGMFRREVPPERQARAIEQVRAMGYDFHIPAVSIQRQETSLQVRVRILNQGVAPFYHPWKLELAALGPHGRILHRWPVDWSLKQILPQEPSPDWQANIELPQAPLAGSALALRAIHPLPNGKALRFANADQCRHAPGWLSLGLIPSAADGNPPPRPPLSECH